MGSPIRILHVAVNMNRGGAETLIMNLYRSIDRANIQFDFLTNKPGVFDSEILKLGGKVHRIPYITEVGHFQYKQSLDHFFKSHSEYRIVHSHMDKMSGLVLQSAAKAGIPVRIAHSHNTSSEGGRLAKLYKWYAGYKIKGNATHLIACSKKASDWLFSSKAENVVILKNGIDCNKFAFSETTKKLIRRELEIPDDYFVMGHVGRFNHQKNHEFLIDVFSETVKEHPKSILLLVGEGNLLPDIQKKVEEMNLTNHVKFLGVRGDVHQLFQAFDVFVFPSFHEGLPVTLIEAQCSGLPCIISDTITNEVDMGVGSITYLPINNVDTWKKTLINVKNSKLRSYSTKNALIEKGYDIQSSTRLTQDLYLKMVR